MRQNAVRDWLSPDRGADEGFRQESLALSYDGARLAGLLEAGAGLAGLAGLLSWQASAGLLILGALTLLARRAPSLFEHLRTVVAVGAGLGAALAVLPFPPGPGGGFALAVAALLLAAAPAVTPLPPWQSLLMGAGVAAAGAPSGDAVPLAAAALAAALLAAGLYRQRLRHYRSLTALLHASQEFREMQSRLVRSDSAATMLQLSAALAHELSSPIGTASSSVVTLMSLASRQAQASAGEQERLAALQSDLGQSLQDSLGRLKTIVNRIQRLCRLEDATTQRANVNELLREAAALGAGQVPDTIEYRWNLGPAPELVCRPQQLIVVFWNLLLNAAQAMDGAGVISITTTPGDGRVEITVEDNGPGIAPERLARIFDPAFQVTGGRVSTGNWGLFTSRQLIQNHGGELRISSVAGRGVTATIHLPCSA